jgi:hypothetical protein
MIAVEKDYAPETAHDVRAEVFYGPRNGSQRLGEYTAKWIDQHIQNR